MWVYSCCASDVVGLHLTFSMVSHFSVWILLQQRMCSIFCSAPYMVGFLQPGPGG